MSTLDGVVVATDQSLSRDTEGNTSSENSLCTVIFSLSGVEPGADIELGVFTFNRNNVVIEAQSVITSSSGFAYVTITWMFKGDDNGGGNTALVVVDGQEHKVAISNG